MGHVPVMIGTGNHVVVAHWKERAEEAEADLVAIRGFLDKASQGRGDKWAIIQIIHLLEWQAPDEA